MVSEVVSVAVLNVVVAEAVTVEVVEAADGAEVVVIVAVLVVEKTKRSGTPSPSWVVW